MQASRTRQHTVFQDYSVLPAFSSVDYIAVYSLQHQPDNTARSWIDAVAGMLQLHQTRPQPRLEI
jgi:ABC-type lipoprotein export system ATPase subunit